MKKKYLVWLDVGFVYDWNDTEKKKNISIRTYVPYCKPWIR